MTSPSFEYNGHKYQVSKVVHGSQGVVAHVAPESPFRAGVLYTSQEIAINGNRVYGMTVFIGETGHVLRYTGSDYRWQNTGVPGLYCLLGELEGTWLCVYSNENRISDPGEPTVSFKVGDTVSTQEEYDSLPYGTIVLDSSRGIAREAIQKRIDGSVRTFKGRIILHREVFDFAFPPLTIVHIPADDA